MAIVGLSGSSARPGASNASPIQSGVGLPRTTRLRDASIAISHTDIAATLRLPPPAATAIASRAARESGSVPAANQSQICVSNKTSRASDVLGISRPFEIVYGADNVAANFDCARHIAE